MGVTSPEAPDITHSGRLTHILLIVCFEGISKQTIISCSTSMHPGEGALWAYESFDHLRIFLSASWYCCLLGDSYLKLAPSGWQPICLCGGCLIIMQHCFFLPVIYVKKPKNLLPKVLFIISRYIASTVQPQGGIFFWSHCFDCAQINVFCCTTLFFFVIF